MPLPSILALLLAGGRIPSTPLLDQFNRGDQNPLAGGWTGPAINVFSQPATLVSLAATAQGVSTAGNSYWTTPFAANQEAYLTLTAKWATDGIGFFILLNLQTPGTVTACGYLFTCYGSSGDVAEIYRIDNTSLTLLSPTVTGLSIAAGDKFLAKNAGNTLLFYQNKGSGWNPIAIRKDSAYGVGFVGLGADNSANIRVDDFGGGSSR